MVVGLSLFLRRFFSGVPGNEPLPTVVLLKKPHATTGPTLYQNNMSSPSSGPPKSFFKTAAGIVVLAVVAVSVFLLLFYVVVRLSRRPPPRRSLEVLPWVADEPAEYQRAIRSMPLTPQPFFQSKEDAEQFAAQWKANRPTLGWTLTDWNKDGTFRVVDEHNKSELPGRWTPNALLALQAPVRKTK